MVELRGGVAGDLIRVMGVRHCGSCESIAKGDIGDAHCLVGRLRDRWRACGVTWRGCRRKELVKSRCWCLRHSGDARCSFEQSVLGQSSGVQGDLCFSFESQSAG